MVTSACGRVSLVPCGAVCACACVRVPLLAWGLFVFLLIGLFFHVQPTKPHVFPLISPARLGWSPQHARGLPAGPERRGGLPTPLARPDQAGRGRVTQLQPCPGPTHIPPPAWHSTPMACPNPILWHPSMHPNFWTLKCLLSASHRLLFLSQPDRADGKVVLNWGLWTSRPDQSNTDF